MSMVDATPSKKPIERESPPTTSHDGIAVEPYRLASVRFDLQGRGLHEIEMERLASWISSVVEIEGPVHTEEVGRRIATSAGVQRVGSRIQQALEEAAAFGAGKGLFRRQGKFLWPPALETPSPRDRSALPPSAKKIAYVCDEEIGEAILHVAGAAFGIAPDDLLPAVGRLIGFGRVTDEMRKEIARTMIALESTEKLKRVKGQLFLRRG